MFTYTIQELGHLNARLKSALEVAKQRKLESEQLALDAARIMVVQPLVLNTLDKRQFYQRLMKSLGYADSKTPVSLTIVQSTAWKYLEKLVEFDCMQVCIIGLIRNNLAGLAVTEPTARASLRAMDRLLEGLLDKQTKKPDESRIETNVELWLKNLSMNDYIDHYPPFTRFLRVVADLYNFKHGMWTHKEISALNKILRNIGLPWQSGIPLSDFLTGVLEEIDNININDYNRLIDASFEGEDIDVTFMQDQVSSPIYLGLVRIAQAYTTTKPLIDGLMEKTGMSRPMTIRQTLLPFMGNQGINVDHVYTVEDLAIEILGARYLASRLHFEFRNARAGIQRTFDPVTRFLLMTNGQEVKDSKNGLVWRRWSEGQANRSNPATAEVLSFTYDAAIEHAAKEAVRTGQSWRLPTIEELAGLIDHGHANPCINRKFFPDTPAKWYWTASKDRGNTQNAWSVGFGHGSTNYVSKSNPLAVRLIRGT